MLDDTIPNQVPNIPAASDEPLIQAAPEPVSQQEIPQEPPPPAGNGEKSEKYLNQLINLINQDKLPVTHTDLNKFDVTAIEDHYRLDLGDYEVEINHSKQPDTGQDFYIMLFNNIKKIESEGQNCVNKVILAYTHLTQPQFEDFKEAADAALEKIHIKEEAKRFSTAMSPIDDVLSNLGSSITPIEEESSNTEATTDKEEPEELAQTDIDDQGEELADEDDEDQNVYLADFNDPAKDSTDDSPKASDFLSQPPQPQPTN